MKEELEQKVKNKVCNGCGGKITVKEFEENDCFTGHSKVFSWKTVCEKCSKLCWGVSEEDFRLAKKLVMDFGYLPYEHMREEMHKQKDDKDYMEYYWSSQISGAYGIIEWFKNNL